VARAGPPPASGGPFRARGEAARRPAWRVRAHCRAPGAVERQRWLVRPAGYGELARVAELQASTFYGPDGELIRDLGWVAALGLGPLDAAARRVLSDDILRGLRANARQLPEHDFRCLVACPEDDPGEIAGAVDLSVAPQVARDGVPGSLYLSSMAVAPERRRQGCAAALLRATEALARGSHSAGRARHASLSLHVLVGNRAARACYEATGFAAGDDAQLLPSDPPLIGRLLPDQKRLLMTKSL